MLVVKTYLKETQNKGIGLFAKQFIPKGEYIWIYNDIIDLIIEPSNIPPILMEFIETYASLIKDDKTHRGKWILGCDNARFINHSFKPNLKSLGEFKGIIASRDININEELIINYSEIDNSNINFEKYE